jgi:predicted nucleic acid-binding protein
MTLTDTGPLIALVDKGDKAHTVCLNELNMLSRPLLTTWPCVSEAMHLLNNIGGHFAQDVLWSYIVDGLVAIHESSLAERARMRELMAKYKDTPMDLADASLVAAAEVLGVRRIFTVDSDFVVYRLPGKQSFDIIP